MCMRSRAYQLCFTGPVYFTQYISPSIFHPVKMCMSGLTRMVFLSEIFCTFVYCSESGSDSDVTDQCT